MQEDSAVASENGVYEDFDVVAHVFPAHRDYARNSIAQGFGPASDHPFGAFRSDRLTYKGGELVEFTTPAHGKGPGTMTWLLPSDQPINGFALLTIGPERRHGASTLTLSASALACIALRSSHSAS